MYIYIYIYIYIYYCEPPFCFVHVLGLAFLHRWVWPSYTDLRAVHQVSRIPLTNSSLSLCLIFFQRLFPSSLLVLKQRILLGLELLPPTKLFERSTLAWVELNPKPFFCSVFVPWYGLVCVVAMTSLFPLVCCQFHSSGLAGLLYCSNLLGWAKSLSKVREARVYVFKLFFLFLVCFYVFGAWMILLVAWECMVWVFLVEQGVACVNRWETC